MDTGQEIATYIIAAAIAVAAFLLIADTTKYDKGL